MIAPSLLRKKRIGSLWGCARNQSPQRGGLCRQRATDLPGQASAQSPVAQSAVEPLSKRHMHGSRTPERPKLALSPEQRERLLQRLHQGAGNAELALEFHLSPRQVQGIRISQARLVKLKRAAQEQPQARDRPASIEEIVRFLRQQDDIVVPQRNGEFLVNARFRLGPTELIERANRMRARQQKPAYATAAASDRVAR